MTHAASSVRDICMLESFKIVFFLFSFSVSLLEFSKFSNFPEKQHVRTDRKRHIIRESDCTLSRLKYLFFWRFPSNVPMGKGYKANRLQSAPVRVNREGGGFFATFCLWDGTIYCSCRRFFASAPPRERHHYGNDGPAGRHKSSVA